MNRLPLTAAMLTRAAHLLAQAPSPACCEMRVISAKGFPASLTVTITNVGAAPVNAPESRGEVDFKVRVTSSNGGLVERTEHGKRLRAGGSTKDVKLKIGESLTGGSGHRHAFRPEARRLQRTPCASCVRGRQGGLVVGGDPDPGARV
jgi:hypothetical protein